MIIPQLTAATLPQFGGGKAGEEIDAAMMAAGSDVRARGKDGKTRKAVVTVEWTPDKDKEDVWHLSVSAKPVLPGGVKVEDIVSIDYKGGTFFRVEGDPAEVEGDEEEAA